MLTCETCRSQMLEYLYDLLESDERQEWEAHLKDCAACQTDLVRAKGQRELLAKAAKMEFTDVRFTAPVAETAITSAPAANDVIRLPQPAPPRRQRLWLAAAAVLLGLSLAGASGWYVRDYRLTEATIANAEYRIQEQKNTRIEAENRLAQLPKEKQKKIEAIYRSEREAQLQVEVQGPASLRAGAPTDYQIYTKNLNHELTAAHVSVAVKDHDRTIAQSLTVADVAPGIYRCTLPPDLPVRPDSQPSLLVSARRDNGSQVELREEMQLAAPVYVTHLEIDKPMYQLGETVYFRSLTLDRFSLKPAEKDLDLQYFLASPGPGNPERKIAEGRTALVENGPAGSQTYLGPDRKPLRGVGAGSVKLDDDGPGGEYALIVREAHRRIPEQRRKFLVNKYDKPRLNKELDFSRKSYGPGDEVVARCKAKYLDGRPLKNCRTEVTVVIDNKQYGSHGEERTETIAFQTDDEGVVNVRFHLPKDIERGLGTVAVKFDDRAMPDTIVRPLPIVLKKLDIEFCPEGGDLVAGLPNRVYFQVRSTLGKPADLRGQLLEDGKPLGVTVATLSSAKTPELNQGTGRFEFTPNAGHKYQLQVDSPIGVRKRYDLPKIERAGVVLSVPTGVVKADETISVTVRSTSKRSLMVGAYCRGRLLDSTELSTSPRSDVPHGNADFYEARAVLRPTSAAGGVCRVTVFEILPRPTTRRALRPVAERLIYRQPGERVNIALKPDQKTYVPRQTVKLGVEATTEKGQPAPSVMLLRVVDKSVVTLADDKTLRSMPAHFLLTTEVRRPEDLEYADFLLGTHPQAAEALDLLLGTQGWRRFAEQDPNKFRNEQKEDAELLLVTIGQSQPQMTDLTQQQLKRTDAEYTRLSEQLTAQVAESKKEEQEARADQAYHAALVKLNEYDDLFDRIRRIGVPAVEGILALAALVCLLLGISRKMTRALPYYAATAVCAAIAVLLVRTPLPLAGPRHSEIEPVNELTKSVEPPKPQASPAPRARPMIVKQAAAPRDAGQKQDMFRLPEAAALKAPAPAPGINPARAFGGAVPNNALHRGMAAMPAPAAAGEARRALKEQLQLAGNKQQLEREMMGRFRSVPKPAQQAQQKAEQPPGFFARPMVAGGRMARDLRLGIDRANGPMAKEMKKADVAELPPMPVRVFSHSHANGPAEERFDFAETLYWHPVLVLSNGKEEVSFDLCDSLGTFEVTAFAHTLDGRLGSATQLLTSRLPFTVQPRTPLEVTSGDTIELPVAIANNTMATRIANVAVTENTNLALLGGAAATNVSVPANTTIRKLYRFRPTTQEGTAALAVTGKADGFPADSVRTTFRVAPEGFPIVRSHSDVLEKSATHNMLLPEKWINGTLKCSVQVYPSTLADLQKGLESLLREPNGCFEQTSTTNYPNVLILQYLKESDQTKPEIERKAHELLDRGYQKLISFECLNAAAHKREGYEWFGGTAPAHEALTAYGLMEFRDMAKVHQVDPAMLKRTHDYLLHQRDGQGGFKRNPQALDTFGRAPQQITNAYIVWALTEGGKDDDISKELNALHEQAAISKDPYFLSLVANSLINRAKTADAAKLLKKVGELQNADGHLDAEQTSITASGGRDLQIETTSLALLGWLKANPGEFNANVQKAIHWLGQQRGGFGGFGSTQSTILALKALILYTKANKKSAEAGELRLFVGDKQVAALPFVAGTAEPLTLSVPDAEKMLKPGKNTVRAEITGKNVFPYTLTWSYQTRQPASAENCPVKLSAKLDRNEARESETVRLNVHVENVSVKGQGMAVAILGLPGGLILPEDMKQLKDYCRPPTDGQRPLVSAFETRGRELVLYWRDLAPDQKIDVPIDLICRIPGEYSGPASRAYLYYNADDKHWIEPLKLRIAAKAE